MKNLSQKKIRNMYYMAGILILMVISTAMTIPFNVYINIEYERKVAQLSSSIMEQKRNYLYTVVNEKISDIESLESMDEEEYSFLGDLALTQLAEKIEGLKDLEQKKEQIDRYLEVSGFSYFDVQLSREGAFQLYEHDPYQHRYRFELSKDLPDGNVLWIGMKEEEFQQITKKEAEEFIRSTELPDNGYIWVNYILDYEGGDNYAIRLVHPNMPETEGNFLSTYTSDSHGNYPYKEELEGMKDQGELYYDYYFKEMNSERISHKLSFAKLYKPYNWVIATGIYLTDVDELMQHEREIMMKSLKRIRLTSLFTILGAMVLSVYILWLFERRISAMIDHFTNDLNDAYNQIEDIAYHDSLSGLWNRRAMDEHMQSEKSRTLREKGSFCFIMLDIDHFKEVNDTYGHDTGDRVIENIARILKENCRHEDKIGRWGGEEFLIMATSTDIEQSAHMAEKIRKAIKDDSVLVGEVSISVTVTLGISLFDGSRSLEECIKIADEMLYKGKNSGRDCVVY